MQISLARGVRLHIIPTDKYTTTRILISFATKQTKQNSAVRNLLVNLLINGMQKYPDQTAVARRLSEMYGAELDGYVTRIGTVHNLRISLNIVNDNVLQHHLSNEAVHFLHDLLFHPLMEGGVLSPQSWQLQNKNLIATLQSWNDDRQYLAAKRLLQLYFAHDSIMQMPSVGTVEALTSITPDQLHEAYCSMIANDQIDIIVVGNVDEPHYQKLFKEWEFSDRDQNLSRNIFYQQGLKSEIADDYDFDDIQQSKLDLAYRLPIYFSDKEYYPALVMNGLFGASPYSLLFTNVREKASLAYYASSGYRPFNGYAFVQSGINSQDRDKAQQLIQHQLMTIQDGKINDRQLDRVKKNIINGYLLGRDNPARLVERELVSALMNRQLDNNEITQIEDVNISEIVNVAQQMKLQAVYFLDGR